MVVLPYIEVTDKIVMNMVSTEDSTGTDCTFAEDSGYTNWSYVRDIFNFTDTRPVFRTFLEFLECNLVDREYQLPKRNLVVEPKVSPSYVYHKVNKIYSKQFMRHSFHVGGSKK